MSLPLAQTLGFLLRDDHDVVLATSGRQAIELLGGGRTST